jgi:hypothetical protein
MSSAVFRFPILRNVYTWANSLPVDKKTFLNRLKNGKSLTFIPVSGCAVIGGLCWLCILT